MRAKALDEAEADLINDPRLAELWKPISWPQAEELPPLSKKAKDIAILIYPDDEGVRLNNGRPGAAGGPARILFYLGRMIHQSAKTPSIFFVSDILEQPTLHARHSAARDRVRHLLKNNYRVITLGGGHDYGYPDASAYYEVCKGKVLNIDAHLDLRPVVNGKLNSGTPFFRFAKKYGGKPLVAWGIQEHCNAVSHRRFAKAAGVKILDAKAKRPMILGPVGISVCLDAFAGISAVSAPCYSGLSPEQGVDAIDAYRKNSRWLGLYECAPKYDPLNEDSARFAALLAYRFIHSL